VRGQRRTANALHAATEAIRLCHNLFTLLRNVHQPRRPGICQKDSTEGCAGLVTCLDGRRDEHPKSEAWFSTSLASRTANLTRVIGQAVSSHVRSTSIIKQSQRIGMYVTCDKLREVDTSLLLVDALSAGKPEPPAARLSGCLFMCFVDLHLYQCSCFLSLLVKCVCNPSSGCVVADVKSLDD
jgi:hypothetical protein